MSKLVNNEIEAKCCFCPPQKNNIIGEDDFSFIYLDKFPVTPGHSLIIPKRHFKNLFDANIKEIESIWNLLKMRKEHILKMDQFVTGFNVGVNVGLSAGQTVFHLHVHLIPRRDGDVVNPKGGVRGVIPERMKY